MQELIEKIKAELEPDIDYSTFDDLSVGLQKELEDCGCAMVSGMAHSGTTIELMLETMEMMVGSGY